MKRNLFDELNEGLNVLQSVRKGKITLRKDIALGISDAKCGHVKEADFASLKQQGRQLLKSRKAAI